MVTILGNISGICDNCDKKVKFEGVTNLSTHTKGIRCLTCGQFYEVIKR